MKYDHQKIEEKWSKKWVGDKTFTPDLMKAKKPYYALFMFPYPSAEGLHIGNFYAFVCTDVMAKYKRLNGFDVFEPFGFDAFGMHLENYALKINERPQVVEKRTTTNFREQVQAAGLSCDYTREVDTTKPEYYKWTQWIFTKLFEKGLAYQKEALLNWCPSCQTVLADEQIEGGVCERCKTTPEKKTMKQWFFRITKYAQRMLDGLDDMDWSEITKAAQKNWIGRSEGARVKFRMAIDNKQKKIYVATGNKAKIERIKKIFSKINPNIILEQIPDLIDVEETKKTGLENSLDKVTPYKGKYKHPIITGDTSIFIEGEKFDPTKVKRIVLGGLDEKDFTKEEVANKIKDYYIGIAKKYGGKKEFYFEDAWSILFPDGTIKQIEYNREYILIDCLQGKLDFYFPIRSLYLNKATGKNYFDQTDDDYFLEFKSMINAFTSVFGNEIEVFTTRPDTLFGATYFVLSPEHPLVDKITDDKYKKEVEKYIKTAGAKSELERTENKEKTGVFTGAYAINPVNNEKIPVWIADYVMMGYGTGAIMAVPAHDERDFEFAKKYEIEIRAVVMPADQEIYRGLNIDRIPLKGTKDYDFVISAISKSLIEWPTTQDGMSINSDFLDGLETKEAKKKIIKWLEKKDLGKSEINYRLRDWCISRQRYWGPPVPIVYCEKCGVQAVPKKDLPVMLPEIEEWEPAGDGKGPLAKVGSFMKTTCPKCNGPAKREADVMDNFLDSAWYFFRYITPANDKDIFDKKLGKKWLPVDLYVGGNEHAVLHLMYTRFITMFLYDLGLINFDDPFKKFRANGMILKDGKKMSKSKGNVINPEEYGAKVGYDALKTYLLFLGPLSEDRSFTDSGVQGTKRWIEKIARLESKVSSEHKDDEKVIRKLHQTIKKVTNDFEEQKYNTAVAALMELTNLLTSAKQISKDTWQKLLVIIAPFAPALAEEMWASKKSIFENKNWPKHDPKLAKDEIIQLVIQINGKLRDTVKVSADISEIEAKKIAQESEKIKKWIEGKDVVKIIFVKGKLINIVIR